MPSRMRPMGIDAELVIFLARRIWLKERDIAKAQGPSRHKSSLANHSHEPPSACFMKRHSMTFRFIVSVEIKDQRLGINCDFIITVKDVSDLPCLKSRFIILRGIEKHVKIGQIFMQAPLNPILHIIFIFHGWEL